MKKRADKKTKKNKRSKIKLILFDIGGVLQLPKYPDKLISDSHLFGVPKTCGHRHRGIHEYLSKKLHLLIDQWFDSIDTSYALSIDGQITEEQAISTMANNLRISPRRFRRLVIKAYKKYFKFNEELFKIALKLKNKGYKIGILSDQWYLSSKALVTSKYTRYFSPVIISCEVGLRKPNPKVYKLALKKAGVHASQTVFIDNQKWNITPAKKLGIKTILFKNNKQTINSLKKLNIEIQNGQN